MKMKNRILSDLVLACTIVLYAYADGTAPKGSGESLSVTDPTAAVPVAYKVPEFLHRMPMKRNTSTDSSGIQRLYGREHTPVEETGEYSAYEWAAASNDWEKRLPGVAGTGFVFLPESDSAPRLFANAKGNERFFWLKPPHPGKRSSKAGIKKPVQTFILKPVSTGDDSMEERIRTGVYHFDIISKSNSYDWMKPNVILKTWGGFIANGTDATPIALISFSF